MKVFFSVTVFTCVFDGIFSGQIKNIDRAKIHRDYRIYLRTWKQVKRFTEAVSKTIIFEQLTVILNWNWNENSENYFTLTHTHSCTVQTRNTKRGCINKYKRMRWFEILFKKKMTISLHNLTGVYQKIKIFSLVDKTLKKKKTMKKKFNCLSDI